MNDDFELLYLQSPVGKGQENSPDDVQAIDDRLRKVGAYRPPPEYADNPQRYATEPLIDSLERYQEQNGLKIDGVARPGGPTERAINNRLLEKPRGAGLLYDPPTALTGTVGNGFENRPRDVAGIKRRLGALNYLPEDPFDNPSGFIDERTTNGIKEFQRAKGLADDGWLVPRGETERALENAVADLARTRDRDWHDFIARAARAQSAFARTLEHKQREGRQRSNRGVVSTLEYRPESEPEPEIIPTQGRGLPSTALPTHPWSISPPPSEDIDEVPGSPSATARFILERILRRPGKFYTLPRQDIAEDQKSGGRLENIHPPASREPYGGRDPSRPAVSPRATGPSPFPGDRLSLPNRTENIPRPPKRNDHIIVLPDPSNVIGRQPIFVENRKGGPPVRSLNRALGAPVVDIGSKVFGIGSTRQIGGPTPDERQPYKENFDPFPHKKDYEITSNAGGSFEDVSYTIKYRGLEVKFVINTVTTGTDGNADKRESRQRAKMVLNSLENTFIVDVGKPGPGETIDERSWRNFVETRMGYIKRLIDDGLITKGGNNQKLLDFFRIYGGR